MRAVYVDNSRSVVASLCITAVFLALTSSAFASDSEVVAPVYRSTSCGQQRWIGGQPSWLDQLILFNDGDAGAPLRSMSFPVCYDGCHIQNRCVGQGGAEDCDCMAPGDMPFGATFQLYDGNPCDGGIQIPGAGGTATITVDMLLDAEIGDGQIDCFELVVDIDPKVQIPHEVWVEANFGHDDAWPVMGQPVEGDDFSLSPLSGLNDGVDCTTFCDQGEPQCQNDPDGCDWFLTNMDSNAEIIFTMQPVPPPAETVWAATSTYSVVGNEAILPAGGDRVFFDVMVSDFDPGGANGTQIVSWQAAVEFSDFTSGLSGTLALAATPCVQEAECVAQMGTGSPCASRLPDRCDPGYINNERSDYLFLDAGSRVQFCGFGAANTAYACFENLISTSVGSPGGDSYLWTLVLDVPSDARGTFTIEVEMRPGFSHLFASNGQPLPLIGMIPGKVTIPAGSCCYNLGSATPACAEALLPEECDALPGPRIYTQNGICDGSCTAGRCCYDLFSETPGCADSLQLDECEALPGPTTFLGGAVCDGSCTTIPRGRCCSDLDSAAPGCTELITLDDCDALPGPRTWLKDGACDGTCTTCLPSSPPVPEMIGTEVVAKNRFLSIEVGDPGRLQALRVTAVSLPPPYDVWNGLQWYAGEPIRVCENSGDGLAVPVANCSPSPGLERRWFWAVPLVCNEGLIHYTDWSAMGLVHLFHEGIAPSRLVAGGGAIAIPSLYDVQVIDRNCDSNELGSFSDPLSITQAAWGDVIHDCSECPCGVPDFSVDIITDAIFVIQKFANGFCAPPKSRADISPTIPDFKVGVVDIVYTIFAFSGQNYPFVPSDPCE